MENKNKNKNNNNNNSSNSLVFGRWPQTKTSEEVFEPFPRPFKKINSFEFESIILQHSLSSLLACPDS